MILPADIAVFAITTLARTAPWSARSTLRIVISQYLRHLRLRREKRIVAPPRVPPDRHRHGDGPVEQSLFRVLREIAVVRIPGRLRIIGRRGLRRDPPRKAVALRYHQRRRRGRRRRHLLLVAPFEHGGELPLAQGRPSAGASGIVPMPARGIGATVLPHFFLLLLGRKPLRRTVPGKRRAIGGKEGGGERRRGRQVVRSGGGEPPGL
mmetsp:Transcript_23127/g.68219  ORF Transcript_23127/g.68219 Transcript_23127/m.68219 type:complete len:208 (+) Transcript_23127:617-1240(+)